MSDDFTTWSPVSWTILGVLIAFFSLPLAYSARNVVVTTDHIRKIVTVLEGLRDEGVLIRPDSHQETISAVVEQLRNAQAPLGEPAAEAVCGELQNLRGDIDAIRSDMQLLATASHESRESVVMGLMTDLQAPAPALLEILTNLKGLRTDMQLLATASHEVRQALTIGLMTDSQEPVPVLPEILTQLRRSERGGLMVQRTLPGFSFSGFSGTAYAKVLARERTQATFSSFHDLD